MMQDNGHLAKFDNTLMLLGFGSVGQGLLPLLFRHFDLSLARVLVASASDEGSEQANAAGCEFISARLAADNFQLFLARYLKRGDVLLNLAVNVSSLALLQWCQPRGVHYLDTCIEPWQGHLLDTNLPLAERTNYVLREAALALKEHDDWGSTALLAHGANPGLSFHFLKHALLDLAAICGLPLGMPAAWPKTREQWASLAYELDVRVIHVAERDSQVDVQPKQTDEFVNTWSVDGFLAESCQPAEIGWGSHETLLPPGAGAHLQGCRSSIYLQKRGAATRIRSWTPADGAGNAFLISLFDAVAMSDYLSIHCDGQLIYRPTVCYAYRPCDDTEQSLLELAARDWQPQARQRLLKTGLVSGQDELGVLLLSPRFGGYWYGSLLSLEEARRLAPNNSATSLQVAAGVLAGLLWVHSHPRAGLVDPGNLAHDFILNIAGPYLGKVGGVMTDWTPCADGKGDPYQFDCFLL
ncbi:homospermidine synthase [Paraburkholderia sp. CI2]|uniref:saccharopine dehydrogenase NADP-binding domain-containing protein n=1 Tax=Paraburkholderia sp. CI2 TaxID=2723093 RepID=UPI001607CFD6|nr:saccharopine dehydrogenase NADP-binding domain-containing protein [Paraburkholderia sp. CI2]MBB5467978.1 homospermidine synthase [Paraburkholderia sp. CI2]